MKSVDSQMKLEAVVEKEQPVTSFTLMEMLRAKYCLPWWYTLDEVRDATGFNATRSADAISIGLYASHGLEMIGFEIKVSRSDWIREMQDVNKSHTFAQFCDLWFLVCSDESIARIEEVPSHWGIMVPAKKKLKVVKMPLKQEPKPITPKFRAALIQRMIKTTTRVLEQQYDAKTVSQKIQESYNRGQDDNRKAFEERIRLEVEKRVKAETQIQKFCDAAGIRLDEYNPHEHMGKALRRIIDNEGGESRREVGWILKNCEDLQQQLEAEAVNLAQTAAGLRSLIKPAPAEEGA